MTYPVCPCDGETPAAPVNLPQLSAIAYRVGDYASFRRAVLTPLFAPGTPLPQPLEQTLSIDGAPVWRTDGAGDLAVMIAEWFAYVADVVAFYNERIANQDYLRTADLPESVNNLIALLGYRPRPAIGAVGALAALLSPGPTFGGGGVVLPQGLQFQSKPTPGQAPQTFELSADTTIAGPDQLPATTPPALVGSIDEPVVSRFLPYRDLYWRARFGGSAPAPIAGAYTLLLQGATTHVAPGDTLLLRALQTPAATPTLATVSQASVGPAPSGGGQQTSLTFSATPGPPAGLTAATASLERANQSVGLWSFFTGYSIGSDLVTIHLASLARQIAPGDWLLFSDPSGLTALAQVAASQDVIWDANASAPSSPPFTATTTTTVTTTKNAKSTATTTTNPLPIPHTQLTLASALPSAWSGVTSATVQFGWVSVGVLLDQPPGPWSGAPNTLVSATAQSFPAWSDQPILLQDATGAGVAVTGSSAGDADLALGTLPDPVPTLQPPFVVLPNLLTVTRGKTIANEVLGSGDAANPAQDFQLSQSPVTYLSQGSGYASTIKLTVNTLPWKEVASFYGQPPDATVFVTREDNAGATHVMFGDGVNGARLPTGVDNVVATYRIGAGAASPPAGKLTVIGKSYPGLRAVLNPVAVGGGADPDQPDQIRRDAPRSVLTFGRAVSVFDFEALAAQVAGVTRASAVWSWNDARQRSLVTIYVGDDSAAAAAAKKALAAAGDPNRPVIVAQAKEIAVALVFTLLVTPGMDAAIIGAGVATALADPEVGLFGSWRLGIGQTVFDSQIEAAVLGVPGAVAITALTFYADDRIDSGPLHLPGEGAFYTLDPADIESTLEPDPNG
jgi:hypothetical protein